MITGGYPYIGPDCRLQECPACSMNICSPLFGRFSVHRMLIEATGGRWPFDFERFTLQTIPSETIAL
jgi:hypothetical protein